MRKQNVLHRLADEDNSHRTYLMLWIFLASIVIGLIWQAAEFILYGEIQGRAVDDIIALAYAVAMIMAYYLGRDDEKEAYMLAGYPEGRIEFHVDPATLKLLLQVTLIFQDRKLITVTLPCGMAEVELMQNSTNAYLDLMKKIEEEKNALPTDG